MAKLGAWLSSVSLVLAGLVILSIIVLALVPLGEELVLGRTNDEIIVGASFFAGILDPVCAVLGAMLVRAAGARVSPSAKIALAAAGVVLVWPVLFYIAFTNCPRGFC